MALALIFQWMFFMLLSALEGWGYDGNWYYNPAFGM